MNDNIEITISKETAEALLKIEERYYFDLFKEIRVSKDEEHRFRDAIIAIVKQIKERG